MGLQLTINERQNLLHHTFEDAYWAIDKLSYDLTRVSFSLRAFPSRDAKIKEGTPVEEDVPVLGYSTDLRYSPELFHWRANFPVEQVFPNGIPLGKDAQYTAVYNFIKEHTGLPFADVFEYVPEKEPEPVVEPEPQIVEEEEPVVEPVVDEPIPEAIEPDTVQTEEIVPYYFEESEETEGQSEEPEEVTEETETETEPEAEPEPEPEIYHNPMQL